MPKIAFLMVCCGFGCAFMGIACGVYGQSTGVVKVGAAHFNSYVPALRGLELGLVVHAASQVEGTHLVDTLQTMGLAIKRLFTPEHGLSGKWAAGAYVADDTYGHLPVISLYGKQKKPTPEQLADIDALVFDLQDVGVRFYTYISTLHYVLEAAAEAAIPVWVLDRPNPNADYIDGPLLEGRYRSFVGLDALPIVYGMTIGELALMMAGEGWLASQKKCDLHVVALSNWHRHTPYMPPVFPSPNLRSYNAIRWYPTLCLFEGTVMSVGRGTDIPFEAVGHPDSAYGEWIFRPAAAVGAHSPKYADQNCYGQVFVDTPPPKRIDLKWIQYFYDRSPNKATFFTDYFKQLAGTERLQKALEEGLSVEDIRKGWQPALKTFKEQRAPYLLYADH